MNHNTINTLLGKIRLRLLEISEVIEPEIREYEADESYFGTRCVRGRRDRGASGKTIVFGIFKRNGKVYTEIVPDVKSATLQAIIRGRADYPHLYTQMDGVGMTAW